MAAEDAGEQELKAVMQQRQFWNDLKDKVNKILPHVDTIIRQKELYEATKDQELTPYKTLAIECTDIEEEIITGVEWEMRECHFGNKVFCTSVENEVCDITPGCWVLAIDDEEVEFGSTDELLQQLRSLGEDECMIEFKQPIQRLVDRYRKAKKIEADAPTDFSAWEAWFFRTQDPLKKMNRMVPKTEKKRDAAMSDCAETVALLEEDELKNQVNEMLARLGSDFTREELGEYNFQVKKVLGQIQKKARELLAEMKEIKANSSPSKSN